MKTDLYSVGKSSNVNVTFCVVWYYKKQGLWYDHFLLDKSHTFAMVIRSHPNTHVFFLASVFKTECQNQQKAKKDFHQVRTNPRH